MKRAVLFIIVVILGMSATNVASPEPSPQPRLVLVVIIDQFRYDYTTRYAADYKGGLARLLSHGAVFTNARFQHFPTVTAVGHSTIMTGAPPSISGIIENTWYDRDEEKQVTSVSDETVRVLGGTRTIGSSPHRLLVSTIGDEMKFASGGKARVIGISLKDRAAILASGHSADTAYWFDERNGNFVTSTYYRPDLPEWVKQFNLVGASAFKGAEWLGHRLPQDDKAYAALESTPFANTLVESLAERALESEQLGSGAATDLLVLSFSGIDYAGHVFGPESPEVRDISIQTDALLDKLFRRIDALLGLPNVLVVLTADHGVAPMPEANAARRMPGGRIPFRRIDDAVQTALVQKYGEGKWISGRGENSLFLNRSLIREKKLDRSEVQNAARDALAAIPHIFRIYTYDELLGGNLLFDPIGKLVSNGFHVRRGADINIVLDPYWMFADHGTTHGSVFGYDTHVPVIFMGPGIRAGRYDQSIVVNDIAPTLATLLRIETPSGSVGRALSEMFAGN
jgi:hypothetical protein